jgi:hypothetical protein
MFNRSSIASLLDIPITGGSDVCAKGGGGDGNIAATQNLYSKHYCCRDKIFIVRGSVIMVVWEIERILLTTDTYYAFSR